MIDAPPEPDWPSNNADERSLLEGFLDGFRTVLLRKAAGLDQDQLARPLAPTSMTLGGLLKHMAWVEDFWFTVTMLGDSLPQPWASVDWEADHDWEWRAADEAPADLAALFNLAVERSRATAARFDSLDAESERRSPEGEPHSLRWIYVHMIEEYARHCGHADLLREAIDGSTGD